MNEHNYDQLSRRERQIVDIIFQLGEATAAEVREKIPDPPSYTTVRTWLRLIEEKGYLQHHKDGPRFVYKPKWPRQKAQSSALKKLLSTFFAGSPSKAIAALIDLEGDKLSDEEIADLDGLLRKAKKKGR